MSIRRLTRRTFRASIAALSLSTAAAVLSAGLAGAADDKFPAPYDSEKSNAQPFPPADAAKGFRVPAGFSVGVFAAEPDVRNPIAMTWDGRGRLWVAENFTYSEREKKYDLTLRDRVRIFEDRDGDGRPESNTVFLDDAQRLTGIEVGLGGVWLMCPPRVLFVPDRDGDDAPDGPAEVVLDGFDVPAENYHNVANGLRWGPDGWLYGRCGASAPGRVRRPESTPAEAVPLAGGLWRYQPGTKAFEPLSHGTTNPWGHDWTDRGEAFFVNSVNGHLWHLIPGAHYRRPHTLSPNPLVYEPMEMHADHWHWDTGKDWSDSRSSTGEHDRLGGGHAHSGAMIYQGGQWPDAFRGRLLTLNLHGRRANVERLERQGTGFVGRREPDTLSADDPFFRGIDLSYGPSGSVFVLDWSDTGECHENSGVHRNSGRVYEVRYGTPAPTRAPDLRSSTDAELVATLDRPEWFARQARRELANRAAKAKPADETRRLLQERLAGGKDVPTRLRALWTLQTLGLTDASLLTPLLDEKDESLRVWAIRLLTDAWPLDTPEGTPRAEGVNAPPALLDRFVRMARDDESGLVRLVLASTLQRLPVAKRPALGAALLSRSADATDLNQPPLVWYGLIPVAVRDPSALAALAADGRFPKVREWTARRLAEAQGKQPEPLDALLERVRPKDEAARRDVVAGLTAGFAGVRKAVAPTHWKAFAATEFTGPDADNVRAAVRGLDVVFGDGRALDEVRRLALDRGAALDVRKAALRSLIEAAPPDLRAVCERLLRERFLNVVALEGLTRFDDPAVGSLLTRNYGTFHPSERPALIDALASRPTFARQLVGGIESGGIPRSDLSAFQIRQIRGFANPELSEALARVWGEIRDSPRDKADLMAALKRQLTPAAVANADRSRGRALFAKTCATCHRLFGDGAEIGPDLTGAGRKDLDYLLSNVVDPGAVVSKDFQMTVFALKDGRVVNGIVTAETDRALTVQTAKDRVSIPRDEIEERKPSPLSLMPDGLLQPLSPEQVRDLIAYLTSDSQVNPPPEGR